MTDNRGTAKRAEKSPRRARTDSHRQFKLLRLKASENRASSAPARLPVGVAETREGSRSASPAGGLLRSSSQSYDVRKSRSPRPQQRRRVERLSRSEALSQHCSHMASTDKMTVALDYEDSLHELCALLIQQGGPNGHNKAEDFLNANLDPPITRQSLGELDICAIVGNSKLRHDVNFDRELHFRPNLDGTKGKLKRKAQAEYWAALVAELELYNLVAKNAAQDPSASDYWNRMRATCKRRIPRMLTAARDILKALVPQQDQAIVDAHLDVPVIMQEIECGVCDLPRIARWLSQALKAHCAPMRDNMIDKIVAFIDKGVEESNPQYLVEGIVQLFGVMEAMKLDVANHQIRHLRLVLIEDTINFEQKYHCSKISRGKLDPERSRQWYRAQEEQATSSPNEHNSGDLEAKAQLSIFINALLNMLLCPFSPEPFPEAFNLDADRLRFLRADINDVFCLDACEKVFVDLATAFGDGPKLSSSRRNALRSTVSSIVNHSPYGTSWENNLDNIVIEVVRQVIMLSNDENQPCGSERETHLRETADDVLRTIFFDPKRSFFWGRGVQVKDQILPQITRNVERYLNCSPVDIFNAFIVLGGDKTVREKQVFGKPSSLAHLADNVLPDIVRRISHIAVLHWRIWAPIVYLHESKPTISHNTLSTVPVSDGSVPQGSRAPAQQLSATGEGAWRGDDQTSKQSNTLQQPPPASPVPATEDVMSGHEPAALADDPPSPFLYRQRTN